MPTRAKCWVDFAGEHCPNDAVFLMRLRCPNGHDVNSPACRGHGKMYRKAAREHSRPCKTCGRDMTVRLDPLTPEFSERVAVHHEPASRHEEDY